MTRRIVDLGVRFARVEVGDPDVSGAKVVPLGSATRLGPAKPHTRREAGPQRHGTHAVSRAAEGRLPRMFLDRVSRDEPVPTPRAHHRRHPWLVAMLSMALLLPAIAIPAVAVSAATCTRTVTSAASLQSALDSAAAGATVCLGANITATNRISINSKTRVTLDGRGYTLKASGYHIALNLRCATEVTVRDLKIVGSHPSPGVYIAGSEHAHGIEVDGGRNLRFERIDIRNMQGDGLYVGKCGTKSWADGVVMVDSRIASNGRHGIAVVAGRNVSAIRMTYYNIAYHLIDVEPDWNPAYQQGAVDLRFEGAVSTGWVGRFTSGLVDAAAFYIGTPYGARSGQFKPKIARVTIMGYVIHDGITGLRTQLETHGGYRISYVWIKYNSGAKTVAGIPAGSGYIQAAHTDYLTVTSNKQPVKSGAYVVDPNRTTNLVVKGNTGSGLKGQIAP